MMQGVAAKTFFDQSQHLGKICPRHATLSHEKDVICTIPFA